MAEVKPENNRKAAALRALHVPGHPLVAPNGWDAFSARIIERAGFSAVSTSSAGVAASLGWADGEAAPVTAMLTAATAIARAVDVPVTVDLERGYGMSPHELVDRVIRTGAVGLNLEDSDPATGRLVEVEEQVAFLHDVRGAASEAGVDLVINARTDSFLRRAGSAGEQLASSIERGNRYLAAGADCVYPLGVGDPRSIATLTAEITGPVNVACGVAGPLRISDLAGLGAARVTFGPGLQRHVYEWFESVVLPGLLSAAPNDGATA